jgi:twitching motility two-component system response regulator PilH
MATILIIDDSQVDLYTLKKIVESGGHEVVTAEDGEHGLQSARLVRPDLILMDIIMPGISGYEATRKLKKDTDTSGIPIIFVTSKTLETDKIWGLRQGAKAYITKPVDEKKLLSAIEESLAA